MNTNNGGQAFPLDPEKWGVDEPGMTLLDYMAAKAMSAYILSLPPDASLNPSLIAIWSYKMAGAMLAARPRQ